MTVSCLRILALATTLAAAPLAATGLVENPSPGDDLVNGSHQGPRGGPEKLAAGLGPGPQAPDSSDACRNLPIGLRQLASSGIFMSPEVGRRPSCRAAARDPPPSNKVPPAAVGRLLR